MLGSRHLVIATYPVLGTGVVGCRLIADGCLLLNAFFSLLSARVPH